MKRGGSNHKNKAKKGVAGEKETKKESLVKKTPKNQKVKNAKLTTSGGEENERQVYDPFSALRASIKNGSRALLELGVHESPTGKTIAWAKTEELHAVHALYMALLPLGVAVVLFSFGVADVFCIWTAAWIFGRKVARAIRNLDPQPAIEQLIAQRQGNDLV